MEWYASEQKMSINAPDRMVEMLSEDTDTSRLMLGENEVIDYCVNRILKINDRNTYVMTILAIKQISYGKGTREEADAVVNCYYDVLKNAPSEEIRFEIVKAIKSAPFHRHEYLQLNPDLAPIVKEIEEMLGEE